MASNNIVNNYCSNIIQIANDVVRRYESNEDIIKRTEGELTDIEHEIELGNSQDLYGGWKLYKQIKELRMQRRQAKNENELLRDMYEYIKSQSGQTFKSKIQSIQSNSAKVYDAQSKRVYTPRHRTDLTIEARTCETNKSFEDMLADFKKDKITMRNGKLRKGST